MQADFAQFPLAEVDLEKWVVRIDQKVIYQFPPKEGKKVNLTFQLAAQFAENDRSSGLKRPKHSTMVRVTQIYSDHSEAEAVLTFD